MLAGIQAAFPELADLAPIGVMGGQKEVFRGRIGSENVVIKIIKHYEGGIDRAEREVIAVEKLKSIVADFPSRTVPRVLAAGERIINSENRYFIIEEFIEGQNLRQYLGSHPVLSLEVTLRLAERLLRACLDFEAVNLVHRDINPRNIMIGSDGRVWVIDFGLARHLDLPSITENGTYKGIGGTLGYTAPEVLRNDKGEVNIRADLFSVGIVLYEVVSGNNPHCRGNPDPLTIVRRVENENLPSLTVAGDRSNAFGLYVLSLCNRFLSRRPQTAQEAWEWFASIRQHLQMGTP